MSHNMAYASLAVMLFTKHFFADGPLQSKYQLINKGTFLHRGGLEHAALHAALTCCCLILWATYLAPPPAISAKHIVAISASEFIAHYLIDWTKCKVEKGSGWTETIICADGRRHVLVKNEMFFTALLADQMFHSFTYIAIFLFIARFS